LVCVRGASALQEVLNDLAEAPLVLFVVWEPVILTDVAPPTTGVMARISDSRVVQLWDRSRVLSELLLRTARDERGRSSHNGDAGEGSIVWDYVLVFPPESEWGDSLGPPEFAGGPVIAVIDEVRSRLARLAAK
jgi:hypothetical protein